MFTWFTIAVNLATLLFLYMVYKARMGSGCQLIALIGTALFGIAAGVTDIFLIRGY